MRYAVAAGHATATDRYAGRSANCPTAAPGVELVAAQSAVVGEAGVEVAEPGIRHVLDRAHQAPVVAQHHAHGRRLMEIAPAAVGLDVVGGRRGQRTIMNGTAECTLDEKDTEHRQCPRGAEIILAGV